jgi:hypothetical protein
MNPRGNLTTETSQVTGLEEERAIGIKRHLQSAKETRHNRNRRGIGGSYGEMAMLAIHSSRFERNQLE